ncbi:ABC transporter ATP-binding protein [Luteibacter flocculans]|uniref:ABC transporter ATP-binding protein n=1 Tax=Luteibacter flocculans TaxID=2780091 RepID=A0ABY4T579_9GAMM|nr:ABC transporter ATP-binding protein [Luteibacter flocculans]URL58485.1 ABC transporter ATP-binding protein [Luteibacter flocculans]
MQAVTRPVLIELRGVGKSYAVGAIECQVLTDVHLSVREGEFVTIAGPSGCGKTTLLSLMGLLDVPTHGELRFAGEAVAMLGRAQRALLRNRYVGFVFQGFNLIDDLNVADNVALPLSFRRDMSARERRLRVMEALASVGMTHRMRHYPSGLSGGQKQRVAVARAVVGDPSVILADEPTGNLDTQNGDIVMALLSQLHASGRTICMVTHEDRFSARADRMVRLFDGRVVDESTYQQRRSEADSGLDERRFSQSTL